MPVFRYRAADKRGRTRKGVMDADSRGQAVRRIRDLGLFPQDVVRESARSDGQEDSGRGVGLLHRLTHRVGGDVLASTTRQLATLLTAGLPLDAALTAMIGTDSQAEITRILRQVRDRIREGSDLARAFGEHAHVFSSTFVTMVRAGENAGSLEVVMERLAEHAEQQLALRRKVQATLAYPALMAVVGVVVVFFLLTFVIPKVTQIFTDLKRALPLPTRLLIAISDFMTANWPFIIIAFCLLALGLYRFGRTKAGCDYFGRLLLRVPVLKSVASAMFVGRFTRTLGMLLKNGVTLDQALQIVHQGAGNVVLGEVVADVARDVQEGRGLTGPMARSSLFSHSMVQLVSAGEKSGQLDRMLLVVADECDSMVNTRLQTLTSLMEPVMILVLGGMVGFVVMAIILPIFEMSNLVS